VIGELGHPVRVVPPSYVNPYVKRNKKDGRDAEAICEAMSRPSMRFVAVIECRGIVRESQCTRNP